MQTYVNQLLEDIANAQKAELSIAEINETSPKSFEEEMEEICPRLASPPTAPYFLLATRPLCIN
nr:hypothetical protein [Bacteroidota bacterium]